MHRRSELVIEPSPGTQPLPLLSVENLRTEIPTAQGSLMAVDGVDFTIHRGEVLGIVGESGSGKSVLGRTVMGLHTTGPMMTVTGRVSLSGTDIQKLSAADRRSLWGSEIGMVFQDPMTALNPVKKIGPHLTETLRKHSNLSRAKARDRAAELLALVGIPEPRRRLDQYPHELSGGMRQRVVIAIALSNTPTLLIADEPTTALDVTVQKQILDLLASLQDELGMAIILISHNLGVVAGRADRVAVMYAGSIVEIADAATLFREPRHPYTEALLTAIPQLANPPHSILEAIEGSPPNMNNPPQGCRFAPRCHRARQDCHYDSPILVESSTPGHAFACHHPVGNGGQ